MNSGIQQDATIQKQETSAMSKFQAVEFTLTLDQYTIIQHFLPKGYTLQQRKSTKRQKGSSHKLIDAEMSRFSGGFENTEQDQGRSKRARTKKIDRYLQQEMPRPVKRTSNQKLSLDEDLNQCAKILVHLKRHPNAVPFLQPVDPKKSGASHYFEHVKDPMDFYTIEKNLKAGQYQNAAQFHADVNKIWYNSYGFNEKSSKIYKMTIEMEKYYKKLLGQITTKKSSGLKMKQKGGDEKKYQNDGQDMNKAEDIIDQEPKSYQLKSQKQSQQENNYDD